MMPYIDDRKCYVDPQICTAINACPQKAISYIENEDLPLGGKIAFDYEKCKSCGVCADTCCGEAIEMRD